MNSSPTRIFGILVLLLLSISVTAQNSRFEPSDTLNKKRLRTAYIGAGVIYTTFSVGLWNAWYKQYPISGFHTFNDWDEWEKMDKAGHFMGTYLETRYLFEGARWTGMDRNRARWTAAGGALLLQTTVEVMDGFSEQWGWSWYDVGFNVGGAAFYFAQDAAWQEQRMLMKISNSFPRYPETPVFSIDGGATTTLANRAETLYAGGVFGQFLKDYNGQTIWMSVNPRSFTADPQHSKLPPWLNIAVGYGAENMYGGFANRWSEGGAVFTTDPTQYPRYKQLFLSFDVDLSRIPTKNRALKALLSTLNFIKIPAPTLEYNRVDGLRGHWIYF